jgi:hypothetical protein
MATKRLRAHNSYLLIVDVQERRLPTVGDPEGRVANCVWLMRVACVLDLPLLISEQYPAGLGSTVAQLRVVAPEDASEFLGGKRLDHRPGGTP